MRTSPLVSVIVPTKNVERTVDSCLRSIRTQSLTDIELIVVDNFSTDRTFEIARQYAHVAIQAGPERSAQRNLAVERSRGDYILWIDADMVLTPRVVEDAVAAAERTGSTAVFIPEVTVGEGFLAACRTLERRCYVGEEMIEAPRLIRREFFEEQGGFVLTVAGQEDADLRMRLLRIHAPMTRIDAPILHDEGRLTFRDVLRKRYYYGQSLPAYNDAQPGAIAAQGLATVKAYLRGVPVLVGDPVHAVALAGLRVAEGVAYAAGAAKAVRSR
ncbi:MULTISPECIES: glycosyltransferase family 2 protein [unclassified Knoellia]|uniref:glycosyltransferase family 2 protein n=1 Tax=Knoellia altitudinis TaxID=3404795 RepID=UPI003622082B